MAQRGHDGLSWLARAGAPVFAFDETLRISESGNSPIAIAPHG